MKCTAKVYLANSLIDWFNGEKYEEEVTEDPDFIPQAQAIIEDAVEQILRLGTSPVQVDRAAEKNALEAIGAQSAAGIIISRFLLFNSTAVANIFHEQMNAKKDALLSFDESLEVVNDVFKAIRLTVTQGDFSL